MKQYTCGVDVGGTAIKFGLFAQDGRLLRRWSIPTPTQNHGREILPAIAQSLQRQALPAVTGVGLGVPGPVRPDGTVNGCINLGWGVTPAAELLSRLLGGTPVKVANDANAAALGECWQGAGKGAASLLLVTLGTGVGGGIVLDGQVRHGVHGSAGEIGHLTVNPAEEERCPCGKRGCLEQYASATGILRLAHKAGLSVPDAKAVFALAEQGDEKAKAVVTQAGYWLGLGLSSAASLLDPEIILLGGGVAQGGALLLHPVRDAFQANVFHAARNTPIRLAALGNDAGIYGAARLALEPQSATTC